MDKQQLNKAWAVYETKALNVLPENDTGEHLYHVLCPCKPKVTIENGFMIIAHNSYDGRECKERLINNIWNHLN